MNGTKTWKGLPLQTLASCILVAGVLNLIRDTHHCVHSRE